MAEFIEAPDGTCCISILDETGQGPNRRCPGAEDGGSDSFGQFLQTSKTQGMHP